MQHALTAQDQKLIDLIQDFDIPEQFHDEVMDRVHEALEDPRRPEPYELDIIPRPAGGSVILLSHTRGRHRNLVYVLVMRTFNPMSLRRPDPWDDWEPANRVLEALRALRQCKTKADRDQALRAAFAVIPEQEELEKSLYAQAEQRNESLPDVDDIDEAYCLVQPMEWVA